MKTRGQHTRVGNLYFDCLAESDVCVPRIGCLDSAFELLIALTMGENGVRCLPFVGCLIEWEWVKGVYI